MNPRPRGAQFNYALILEALSLNAEALEAWSAAEREGGEWGREAGERRAALSARISPPQWKDVQARLDAALDAHNAGEALRYVALFPASAEKHFENDVLRRWAESPTPQQLARATTLASALSQFFKDPYFNDVAAALAHPSDALRQGHLSFAEALSSRFPAMIPQFKRADRLLRQGGSPQWLLARVSYAANNATANHRYDLQLHELDAIGAEAQRYPSVLARIELNRLNAETFDSRYTAFFDTYDAVKKKYETLHDWEDVVEANTQAIGTMEIVGLKEASWKLAMATIRELPRLPDARKQQNLMRNTAVMALELGHPEAAQLYQNLAVQRARAQKESGQLVSDLGRLATIEVQLRRYGDARRHLDEASRIDLPPALRVALQARLTEAQGELAMHLDPAQAVAALTEAIALARDSEYKTLSAQLLARRADAYTRLGEKTAASADRRDALRELHAEEEKLLGQRRPGRDDIWNSYFSRFQETYDLLIRQLIADRDVGEAFRYADRARAFEVVDLVRKLPAAPAPFRELAADPEHLGLGKLQANIPPGTFIIEYRVFGDQTYAWIVGRNVFTAQPLPAQREQVMRWLATLQSAAAQRNAAGYEAVLQPAYDALLKKPLDLIHHAPGGGAAARIVIVPDRDLRGMPFAALRDPDTKHYLIEDHTVSMAGSALLYVFSVLRDRELPANDTSALLVGDPAFDPGSPLAQGLKRLKSARDEVAEIRPLYRSELLMDENATPERFLRMAGGAAVVHVAAHGVVNGDAPSQSFLLLDGLLTAQTLMSDLHTDKTRLVVLGACSSAGGLPVGAEGIAPLVRPLVGAGVPGVVGALSAIDDATAARLLVSFHRRYRDGKDAAEALREAQLEMLRSKTPGENFAYVWAPFQAIGHASSPFASMANITKEKPP
jgi:CHAT domain-containing protein